MVSFTNFLIGILIFLSIYIRGSIDFNFFLYILIIVLTIWSIKGYGEKLKNNLEDESTNEIIKRNNELMTKQEEIKKKNDELITRQNEIKRRNNELIAKQEDIKRKNDELVIKSPLKSFDQIYDDNLFLDEIRDISTANIEDVAEVNTRADNVISSIIQEIVNIEKEYYPKAFSKHFDASGNKKKEYQRLRGLYNPNNYRNDVHRKNKKWAQERIFELDEEFRSRNL